MKLHGFSAQVYPGRAIYLVAHFTDLNGIWTWPATTKFRDAAYCLN